MFTMKIYNQNDTFNNVNDVINFMLKTNFKYDISIYDSDSKKAYEKVNKIFDTIKEYNTNISLDNQILPSTLKFRGILGALGVQVYNISFTTYKQYNEDIQNHIIFLHKYNEKLLNI